MINGWMFAYGILAIIITAVVALKATEREEP